VGRDAGLPLHHFPLADTGRAHAAVADGTVGKVLIDVVDVVDVVGQREVVDGAGGA
jgi:hypothetical protein